MRREEELSRGHNSGQRYPYDRYPLPGRDAASDRFGHQAQLRDDAELAADEQADAPRRRRTSCALPAECLSDSKDGWLLRGQARTTLPGTRGAAAVMSRNGRSRSGCHASAIGAAGRARRTTLPTSGSLASVFDLIGPRHLSIGPQRGRSWSLGRTPGVATCRSPVATLLAGSLILSPRLDMACKSRTSVGT